MKMKPMGDQILIKEEKKSDKTESGIILVDGAYDEEFVYAEVIAIGPGLFTQTGNRLPMSVNPGDTVLISKNNLGSQKKIKFDGTEYILVREMEISMVSN
jgi:co-chaperonin GroES (HSP10)